MIEILRKIAYMYSLIKIFRELSVSDIITMVTNAVEELFKEQTASTGNV